MDLLVFYFRYSSQVENLQRRLNDELQQKAALSSDIRVLLGDITSLKTRQQNLEEEYKRQKDELKEQFEKEKLDVVNQYIEQTNQIRSELNGQAQRRDNIERQNKNLSVQIDSTRSTYDAARGGVTQNDTDTRVIEEIRKREVVEQENKKLLYEMNALLSKSQAAPAVTQSVSRDVTESSTNGFRIHGDDARDDTRTRELEKEVKKLKRVVEDIRSSSDSEKSDLENRNKELEDEVNYMSVKRREMLERQKGLVDNIEKLTSSVKEMETRNMKLSEELFRLTVKLENIEQGKTTSKERRETAEREERDLATEEIIREKRDLEGRLRDQDNKNRTLEDTIRKLETDFQSVVNGNGPQRGIGQIGGNQFPGMNQYTPVVDQQKDELERRMQSTVEQHRNEVSKLEDQKQRMKDDFDREKEDMRRRFEDEKREFERRMKDLENNIRNSNNYSQTNQAPRDDNVLIQLETIRHQFEMEKGELERRFGNEKQQLKMQFDVLIEEEKRRFNTVTSQQEDTIRNLRNVQRDLEDRLKDMERRNERERYDLTLKFNDEKKRLQDEMEDDFKRRLENVKHEYRRHVVDEEQTPRPRDNRAPGQGRGSIRELITEDRLKEIVSNVLKDHGKSNNGKDGNLDKKIADIQKVFDREKVRYQQDKDNSLRQAEQKKAAIEVKVMSLTSDVLRLKEEKKELWRTHRLEKDRFEEEFRRKEREMKNGWIKSKEELTIKLQKDFSLKLVREKMPLKNALDEMKRKLVATETKLKDLDAKMREEKRELENAWDQERVNWRKKLEEEKKKLQTHLEGEFLRKITREKEIYERTLQELRYEISQLQDQRRVIQEKISSEKFTSSLVTVDHTSVITRNTTLKKEEEFNLKVKREKRVLNERIEELEAELETLQKENQNYRSAIKQEKVRLKAEFEQERDRIVDKMRKEKETMRTMYEERLKMENSYSQVSDLRPFEYTHELLDSFPF